MPYILSVAHSLPPHRVAQAEVRTIAAQLFHGKIEELDTLLEVFEHSQIDYRHLINPLDWYASSHRFVEINQIYRTRGLELAIQAAEESIIRSGIEKNEVTHIIFVSSTGHATPTLDTALIERLGLLPTTTRVPIWGLGCAGGAAGLARAHDYCLAYPRALVLVVTLECCSLTLLADDVTKKNLIATAIFADGAAAAIVAGENAEGQDDKPHVRTRARRSHLFPDTARIMGWDFEDHGMRLVLSPLLPQVVKRELAPLVDDFLASQRLDRKDVVHYVTHPGGARVLEAYREALGLSSGELSLSEETLREHGNMSSVTVLVTLEKWLAAKNLKKGPGLLSAFGPGFSAELLLLEA